MHAFENVFNHSKNLGIDECEISAVSKKITTVRITDSNIAELKQNSEESFGMRVINGKKITSYKTCKNDLNRVIEELSRMPSTRKIGFWRSLPDRIGDARQLEGTFDKRLDEIDSTKAADIAQEMINSALDAKIDTVSGALNIVSEEFEISNSNGLYGLDRATYISGMINSESGDTSGFGQQCCRTLDKFLPEKIGIDSKHMCISSVNPVQCKDSTCTLILEPYSVGELLAFVVYPNLGLRLLAEKKSCFANQFGEQIAADGCSIIDDPHVPQAMGTKPFDEEGVQTSRNILINDGVFQNVFSNLYDGFKEGRQSTGNAVRQGQPMGRDADPIPSSMPHNLHVMPGELSTEDMIKDTRHGLLIGRLWYTYALNPIRGDFSCTARSGIKIIENGKITDSGKPVRIMHSLPAMLKNISGIGKDVKSVMQWASIPSIAPAIRVEGVPVRPV